MSDSAHTWDQAGLPAVQPGLPLLAGRVLRLARLAWIASAAVALAFLLSSLPGYAARIGGQLFHAPAEQLGGAGRLLAAASGVASLGSALLAFCLAWLLYGRRFHELAAAVLAFYLLAYSVIMAGPLEFWGSYWIGDTLFASTYQAILMSTPTLALFALFPNGRFIPSWMRWVLLLSIPWSLSLLFFGPVSGSAVAGNRSPYLLMGAVFATFILLGMYAQVYRYRHVSSRIERQQTRWVVLGLVLWFSWIVISTGPYLYLTGLPEGAPTPWWAPLSEFTWWLSLAILPISLTVAIMRFGLWNIGIVINRALVFAGLTLASIALYGLVLAGLGLLFRSSDSVLLPLIATGVAVLTFQPLRARLQAAVNRMMYGERDDPVSVISQLGAHLTEAASPEATLQQMVETVGRTLKLPYVAIQSQDPAILVARHGNAGEQVVRVPLIYQGQAVGSLCVSPRPGASNLSAKDTHLLETVARQAGAVAYNAELTADLQRARQRLVNAREEERRRIRRDLHDGLGPQLASLGLKIDAARNLLATKPEEANQLLAEAKGQAQDAVADIRRLVYDLRPPALDELGLLAALRERAAAYSDAAGPQVSVTGPDPLPALPAAVEVAAYRIALEAVNNAARHGQASHCSVTLGLDRGLTVEIVDDGNGLPDAIPAGVGLASMRERTAELGGSLTLTSRPQGGVRVLAWLPFKPEGTS